MSTDSPGGIHRTFVSGGVILLVLLSGISLYRLERLTPLTAQQNHQKGSGSSSTRRERVDLPEGLDWRKEYVPLSAGTTDLDEQHPSQVDIRLRVRNLEESAPLYIRRVDLYSDSGEKLQSFSEEPFLVKGFAWAEFLVKAGDIAPLASKAKADKDEDSEDAPSPYSHFLIEWGHKGRAQAPLIEAETLDPSGHIVHVREGRPLRGVRTKRKEHSLREPAPYPEPPLSQAPPRPSPDSRSYELVRPKPDNNLHPKGF
jgi:hypothetical protein